MKISHFPDFLPDETVFSVASRYLDRMQFTSPSIVGQHFFGKNVKGVVTELPSNLDHLIQFLPPYHRYTADMIINQYTLFPLYAPFLCREQTQTLRQRMKADGTGAYWIAGLVQSKIPRPRRLRYCSECVKKDRLVYGECYWHRVHQIPGVLVCPTHEIMLESSGVNMQLGERFIPYSSAERSIHTLSPGIVSADFQDILVKLAKNAKWMLDNPVFTEQEDIKKRYLKLFEDCDFITFTGKLRYTRLKKAVLDYYSAQLLEHLNCGIVPSKKNWLASWATMQHPLYHLLLLQFFCETAQEFFVQRQDHSDLLYNPPQNGRLTNGPWPCLNPLCLHYKDLVINTCAIKRGNQNTSIATFSCSCGFTYSRTISDVNRDNIFRIGRVSQYGDVWDRHLATYWLDQKLSTEQVAQLMHASVPTICRQAARLSLPFSPNISYRGNRPKTHQDSIREQVDFYRALWKEALITHPNAKRSEIMAVAGKARSWLRKHDTDWFNEHLPVQDLSSNGERLKSQRIQLQRERYLLVDADLAKSIREKAAEIQLGPGFPIQITQQLLVNQIDEAVLLQGYNATAHLLPLTRDALKESIEGYEAFLWRKLRWAVETYLLEQTYPSYRAFLKHAHIALSTALNPAYKHFIQMAYSNLHANVLLSEYIPKKSFISENTDNVALNRPDSFAHLCFMNESNIRDVRLLKGPRKLELTSMLLLVTAAVLDGAETYAAIANWGYQNEKSLLKFGFPKGYFPTISTIQRLCAEVNIVPFEDLLARWLHDNFSMIQIEIQKTQVYVRNIYVPGIWLLRQYRQIAPAVIAQLY